MAEMMELDDKDFKTAITNINIYRHERHGRYGK